MTCQKGRPWESNPGRHEFNSSAKVLTFFMTSPTANYKIWSGVRSWVDLKNVERSFLTFSSHFQINTGLAMDEMWRNLMVSTAWMRINLIFLPLSGLDVITWDSFSFFPSPPGIFSMLIILKIPSQAHQPSTYSYRIKSRPSLSSCSWWTLLWVYTFSA